MNWRGQLALQLQLADQCAHVALLLLILVAFDFAFDFLQASIETRLNDLENSVKFACVTANRVSPARKALPRTNDDVSEGGC